MKLFTDIGALPGFRNPVVTVGSFDGVHRGHSRLIEIMRERAAATDGETVVVTFARHPRRVLRSEDELGLLTSLEEKAFLLKREGVDNLVVMPFDAAVSRMSPEDFIRDFLVGKLGVKELVAGYNHHFGRDKAGSAATLRDLGDKFGLRIHEAAKLDDGGEKISSTVIRDIIRGGDMEHAARLLGHPYIVMAEAETDGALLIAEPLKLLPPAGEYAVSANGRRAKLTIGADGSPSLEPAARGETLISF